MVVVVGGGGGVTTPHKLAPLNSCAPNVHWHQYRGPLNSVLPIRIPRIHMFLGLPDTDPFVIDTNPDPSIIKQK